MCWRVQLITARARTKGEEWDGEGGCECFAEFHAAISFRTLGCSLR